MRIRCSFWGARWRAYDVSRDYARIKVPVLYVLSRTDALFPPSLAPGVMAGLRGAGVDAAYVEIDSAHGHLASGVDAGKWAPALRDFIAKLEANADNGYVCYRRRRGRSRHHLPPVDPAFSANSGSGSDGGGDPGRRGPCSQRDKHAAVARLCAGGGAKEALVDAVQAAFDAQEAGHRPRRCPIIRTIFSSPTCRAAERWAGSCMGCWGSPRGEAAKTRAQHRRNFQFFDAPVGLIFTVDRRLATGSWLDYGMFLQNVMTAARGRGLDTCAQAAWTHFHLAIRPVLGWRTRRPSSVAWRWATPTRTRRRTRW